MYKGSSQESPVPLSIEKYLGIWKPPWNCNMPVCGCRRHSISEPQRARLEPGRSHNGREEPCSRATETKWTSFSETDAQMFQTGLHGFFIDVGKLFIAFYKYIAAFIAIRDTVRRDRLVLTVFGYLVLSHILYICCQWFKYCYGRYNISIKPTLFK